ncbi:MAG: PspC domain-containing protein [Minisyncoccia bacterium]
MTTKRLYRSNTNKVLCGVIGGVGEYFDIDPTILRLGYIILAFMSGFFPALIGYFVAVIIVPKRTNVVHHEHTEKKED